MTMQARLLAFLMIPALSTAAVFIHRTPARAASAAEWSACESAYPAAKRIAACTRIIANKRESKEDRIKAHIQRAWAHAFEKANDRAFADMGEAIELDPKRSDSYEIRARMLANAGEVERPLADLSMAISRQETAWLYQARAELYRKKGDAQRTTSDLRRARVIRDAEIAERPKDHWLYYSRSELNRDLGDIENAHKDFEQFFTLAGEEGRNRIAERGDILLRKGLFDKAIADYTAAIRQDPKNTRNYDRRALAYRLSGDLKNAMRDYDRLVRMHGGHPEYFIGRGMTYVAMGKPERAIVDFTKAIDIFPEEPTAYYNRAQAARESGNAEVAVADYTRAIELDPRYAVAFNSRGRAFVTLNETARAREDFNKAIGLDPRLAAAYLNRGALNRSAGLFDEAIADFSMAIALRPNNKEFLLARGMAWADKVVPARAESDFAAALAIDPVYAQAYVGRAASRLAQGKLSAALDDSNRALLTDAQLPSAYLVRADVHKAMQRLDQAEADHQAGENVRMAYEEQVRRAAEELAKGQHVRIAIKGDFQLMPEYLNRTLKLDNVIEISGQRLTFHTPGLRPYTLTSGETHQEKFKGLCNGKPGIDEGTRVVTAAVEKYLVHVETQSSLDFRNGACKGKYNYYKESFLIDLSDGECKFSYRQDRDLSDVGAFDNNILDAACMVERLR